MESNILDRMNIIGIKYEFKESFDFDSFSKNHSNDDIEILNDYISYAQFLFIKESDLSEGELEIDFNDLSNPRNEFLILIKYKEDGENYILGFIESYYDHFLDIIEEIKKEGIK